MAPTFQSITFLLSPYHLGVQTAVGHGPPFLKSHGIIEAVQRQGIPVHETTIQPVEDAYEGDIARSFELLRRTATAVRSARAQGSFPIVLAGNCTASVGVAAGLADADDDAGEDISCVWFDAHDDFNTPETLLSGYFDSMPVAMLGGLCWQTLLATVPGFRSMDLNRLIHVGMRDVTELERNHVLDAGLSVIWGGTESRVDFAQELSHMLDQKKLDANPMLVHVDLDCLDTSIGKANRFAAPGGLLKEDLLRSLEQVVSKGRPAALTFASFDPSFEGASSIADVAVEAAVVFVAELKTHGVLNAESAS